MCIRDRLTTNQHTPFASLENEKRRVEICDSLSIGAAIENMILTATGYGLGTLWIANTCLDVYKRQVLHILLYRAVQIQQSEVRMQMRILFHG